MWAWSDEAKEAMTGLCPRCPHPRAQHWRRDHTCQAPGCRCIGTAPIPEEPR
jgi:hypothetical protein